MCACESQLMHVTFIFGQLMNETAGSWHLLFHNSLSRLSIRMNWKFCASNRAKHTTVYMTQRKPTPIPAQHHATTTEPRWAATNLSIATPIPTAPLRPILIT
jgi:hypothetical protein